MSGPPDQVLVVGTYPPIPLPAATATVEAVRRAWARGDEVTVVSPRLSAAHLAVPVVGVFAGRRLQNLRRHTSAAKLVLVMETGVPIPPQRAVPGMQRLTTTGLVRAFAQFDHVTLVIVEGLAIPTRVETRLRSAAAEVIDHASAGPAAPGVTPLGPVEVLPRDRPRQVAAAVARRLLGRYAGPLRARVARLRRQS